MYVHGTGTITDDHILWLSESKQKPEITKNKIEAQLFEGKIKFCFFTDNSSPHF